MSQPMLRFGGGSSVATWRISLARELPNLGTRTLARFPSRCPEPDERWQGVMQTGSAAR